VGCRNSQPAYWFWQYLEVQLTNSFAAGWRLHRSIATSLNLNLNTLRHSITSSPSHQSEFSSETTENISWNQFKDMTNNNCNESPQNNNDGTPASAEMNSAVWEQILQVIAASVAWGQSQSHNASQCGLSDSSEPSEPCGSENNNNDDRNFSWKSADIDLFYPNMLKNWGDSDVVDKNNKNYYWNVYSFINWVRVAAATWDAKQIHQNLNTNLCEEAELWWNTQLSEITCLDLVAHFNSVKEWCKALEKHFKVFLVRHETSSPQPDIPLKTLEATEVQLNMSSPLWQQSKAVSKVNQIWSDDSDMNAHQHASSLQHWWTEEWDYHWRVCQHSVD
jgi:hypothetical protein